MRIKLLLFFLVFWNFSIFPQNLDVTYKMVYRPNKNNLSYIEEDIFVLKIRDHQSLYFSIKYDYLINHRGEAMRQGINPNKVSNNYFIIKEDSKIFHLRPIDNDFMKYEEKEFPKWDIKDNIRQIDSLKAFKAEGSYRGREYIAWFTTDIPIAEGPFKFKNLPGLILELRSKDGDYSITLNGIERNEEEIDFPEAILIKNREKYKELLEKFAENPSYKMQQRDSSNSFKYKTYIGGKEVNNAEKYKAYNKFVWDFMNNHNNSIEKDELWIR
ncbi:GLPGLI family protein [Riemerella anatipestifer]|uniref:GLPGLI family protein n=1 Tax=Riemerella anatipestifer TaxID=34085 RepID=UPI00236441EF|nr:GLPGLI family protein [Riemerella anatipestifer]MDD1539899.1 GLPGLI family protein [Riemerella anatipestifer]